MSEDFKVAVGKYDLEGHDLDELLTVGPPLFSEQAAEVVEQMVRRKGKSITVAVSGREKGSYTVTILAAMSDKNKSIVKDLKASTKNDGDKVKRKDLTIIPVDEDGEDIKEEIVTYKKAWLAAKGMEGKNIRLKFVSTRIEDD